MIPINSFGLFAVIALSVTIAALIGISGLRHSLKQLLIIGLVLRLVGSQIYYYLSQWIYGFGDYSTYFGVGSRWAAAFLEGATVTSPYLQETLGTGLMVRSTGVLILGIGPTINGAFLIFGMIGYVGIVALAVAFARAHPKIPMERYLAWIVFFPSLWYWPAALGKDAVVLAGIGLSVLGYIGKQGRLGWIPLVIGLALVYVIRPQVAVVVVATMLVSFWLSSDEPWTMQRLMKGVMLGAVGFVLAYFAGRAMGFDMLNFQEVDDYLQARGSASAYGGSAVQTGIIAGLVNVLMRPFPWEAGGIASMIAAAEILSLYGIALWKREEIAAFFRSHRRSRFVWFGIVFIFLYALLTGMALGNLGLIARQRVHLFPFVLMLFAGTAQVRQTVPRRQRRRPIVPAYSTS